MLRRKRRTSYHRALITGATSGIGAAFARELPAATSILLTGRNSERLADMRAELQASGREVDCMRADLARLEDRDKLIAQAEGFGIDLLVNNAGLGPYGPVLENGADFERTAAEVNVVATADLTRRLLPGMISRAIETGERAGLINVSSTLAFQPLPFLATYAASKMFIWMYTQALAAELRFEPIDVLTLCPGPTRTAFGRRAGFSFGSLPGAFSPETVARQGLDALGRRSVHVMGPVSRSLLTPGLAAQRVVTQGLGVAMRLVGRRGMTRRRPDLDQ
jgi:short-subunit dehydrogenase